MKIIQYRDLDCSLAKKVENLANPTLPQGQSFFLENDDVIAIEDNLKPLFLIQNSQGISTGDIQEIVFEEDEEDAHGSEAFLVEETA
jgi:hypothetical protein